MKCHSFKIKIGFIGKLVWYKEELQHFRVVILTPLHVLHHTNQS